MKRQKDFPKYDDISNIDSGSVSQSAKGPDKRPPRVDPTSTAYTEMYVAGTDSIENNMHQDEKH